jgi:hypothetical protein
VDSQGVCFAAADGVVLAYPHPVTGPVFPEEGPRWPLARTADGGYTVTDPQTGRVLSFSPTGSGVLPLDAISDRNSNRMDLVRDEAGMPVEIRHTGGYRIVVESSGARIAAMRLLTDGGSGRTRSWPRPTHSAVRPTASGMPGTGCFRRPTR